MNTTTNPKIVHFKAWTCVPIWAQYSNGRRALRLIDAETGEAIATCTVNLPDEFLDMDEVIIKSYEENEGMHEALVKAEIIYPAHRRIQTGWVTCGVCKLVDTDLSGPEEL
jgi:hypothetical protein